MSESDRDAVRLFTLASMAAATGQHEQVATYVGKVVAAAGRSPLSTIAFDKLSVSYKSLVDKKRFGVKCLRRFDDGDVDHRRVLDEYARHLARETVRLCRDFCAVIDRHLLPDLDTPTHVAHAHKLKADFYRYMYEVSEGSLREWSAAKACRSYQRGYDTLYRARCSPLNPIRLDLAVNFAVCLECVFGAEHAAAFVRRVLDDTLTATDHTDEGSVSLRDLRDHLTHLDACCRSRHRAHDDENAVDLGPGFCTSDSSDAEPDEF